MATIPYLIIAVVFIILLLYCIFLWRTDMKYPTKIHVEKEENQTNENSGPPDCVPNGSITETSLK